MSFDVQIRRFLETHKEASVTFAMVPEEDFGDGPEAAMRLTLARGKHKLSRDVRAKFLTEPGFLSLVLAETILTMGLAHGNVHWD
jgi:hypothetical protein